MKKFFRSAFLKALALLLIGALALSAAYISADFVTLYREAGDEFVYGFEESFESCRYLDSRLSGFESLLYDALAVTSPGYGNGRYGRAAEVMPTASPRPAADGEDAPAAPALNELAEKALEIYERSDSIDYYVELNGEVYTNCGAESRAELMERSFYRLCSYNGDNITEFSGSGTSNIYYRYGRQLPEGTELTICSAMKETQLERIRGLWLQQEAQTKDFISDLFVLAIAALVLTVYLIIVWGAGRDGEAKRWHGIWTELWLGLFSGFAVATAALVLVSLETFWEGNIPLYLARGIAMSAAGLGTVLTVLCLLELVRKLKLGRFFSDSICFRIVRWCWRLCISILRGIWRALRDIFSLLHRAGNEKSSRIFLAMLFVYSLLLGLCAIFTPEAPLFLFLGIALVVFAAFVLIHRARDLDAIKTALRSIRAGQLSQTLPEIKSDDLKATAADVEEIAAGLESALAQRLKAERLKTELITNVSHDLKTPLTSIINYTQLLRDADGLSEEARDYVSIIAAKSERLRVLTEDLFTVSKVQSGAEEMNFERLSASLLIEQALAEREREIAGSGLSFFPDLDADLYFLADGRRMSRVLGNLIDNALKYSMPGTRVFISAKGQEGKAQIEIKNIASYLMDFDPEEICGRFVRADDSRTDGGSGLGLAIAKSFTEACGGDFRIVTDGDLFKAVISFPAV